ncbi:hypothetical protein CW705_00595 [Candidatus Bathyarchaeota archaeon]|nr:MAG: hypothetical protein CW705_00595 [Candidatus Bathyarchaeota archaeon]
MSLLQRLKIRIRKVEERDKDYWVDMSIRRLRQGKVRYYRVKDELTGNWLFKVCRDDEMERVIVKALKCPPGGGFVQLEGRTMLFQKGLIEGYYYDVISLSYMDEEERLRRNVLDNIDDVPEIIKENFKVMKYEEVTGKKIVGKRLVVLCEENNEKDMILLFLIQRAWPISRIPLEIGMRASDLLELIRELEKAKIDEIYEAAENKFKLERENIDMLLELLEREGTIQRSEDYIKTKN